MEEKLLDNLQSAPNENEEKDYILDRSLDDILKRSGAE